MQCLREEARLIYFNTLGITKTPESLAGLAVDMLEEDLSICGVEDPENEEQRGGKQARVAEQLLNDYNPGE